MLKAKKGQVKARPTADMAEPDRRPSEGYLLRLALAQGQTLTKNSPEYETLCNYGIIHPMPT